MPETPAFVASGETLIARLLADFRREVNDKLSVVAHRAGTWRAIDEVVFRQCEDFLVEQAESMIAQALSSPREGAVILTPTQIEEKEEDESRVDGQ
jgi:hypothetical protein